MVAKRQPGKAVKTVDVPLDAVSLAFLRQAGRDLYPDRRLTVEEVILDLIHSAIIDSFEKSQSISETTGRAVTFQTTTERDRAALESLGIDRAGGMSAAEIVAHRKALGLTQRELAARLKVDVITVSRWERGRTSIRPREAFNLRMMLG